MRQAADIAYLEYTVNILHNLFANNPLPLQIRDKFDKRTKKIYQYVSCETKCLTVLNEFRSLWYDENKIKVIPNNLKLTPLVCAIWFADDGCVIKNKNQLRLQLATNSFRYDEVISLSNELQSIVGGSFPVYAAGDGWTIHATTKSTTKFVEYIDPVFNFGMDRKSNVWR